MERLDVVQLRFVLLGAALATTGCSGSVRTYPVTGTVTYADGTPVRGGFIELEGMTDAALGRNARGLIQEDGSYSLRTPTIGDGAVPGRHRAIVREPFKGLSEAVPENSIDRKYWSYETSDLEITVDALANEIPIVVTRPGGG